MKVIPVILLAVLAVGLATVGGATYATNDDIAQSLTIPQPLDRHEGKECNQTYYANPPYVYRDEQPKAREAIQPNTLCHTWKADAASGRINTVSIDRFIGELFSGRDQFTIKAKYEGTFNPDQAIVTLWKDEVRSRCGTSGDSCYGDNAGDLVTVYNKVIAITTVDSTDFEMKYRISGVESDRASDCGYWLTVWWDTPQVFEDEAIDRFDLCDRSEIPKPPPEPEPLTTGVKGKAYIDTNGNGTLDPGEPGVPNQEVIAVSLSDTSDVNRMNTGPSGDYSFALDAGGYLVQIVGGGPQGFSYVDIAQGQILVLNLIP